LGVSGSARFSGRLELQVEALVLEGFPPGAQAAIARAFEQELSRLILEEGLLEGNAPASLTAALLEDDLSQPFPVGSDRIGAQIARSVYRCFARLGERGAHGA
jgi:hypothetical protein